MQCALTQPTGLLALLPAPSTPRRALDIAAGTGRNSLCLAAQGWEVVAVDRSRPAIEILTEEARSKGLALDARIADLETGEFQIEPDSWDLICDCYYLQRDLFPEIRSGIRPGGVFVAEIPMVDHTPGIKPMNPAFLLESGELHALFQDWEMLHYREGKSADGSHGRNVVQLIARRPAS